MVGLLGKEELDGIIGGRRPNSVNVSREAGFPWMNSGLVLVRVKYKDGRIIERVSSIEDASAIISRFSIGAGTTKKSNAKAKV